MKFNVKKTLCIGMFVLAIVNFAAFWVMAVYLGGDAVNGGIRDGHYYLMSHGRSTEVSAAVFNYSKWHAYSVWVTHPLGLLAAFVLARRKSNANSKDKLPEEKTHGPT